MLKLIGARALHESLSSLPQPKSLPNSLHVPESLVITNPALLREVLPSIEGNGSTSGQYDFTPDENDDWLHSVRSNVPFPLSGVIDTYGVILPYFELTVTLATKKSFLWVGFDEIGGAELRKPASVGSNKPVQTSNISFDTFGSFDVGDTVGIGIDAARKVLYITINGDVSRSDVPCERQGSGFGYPTVRLKGGPVKFAVNWGGGSTPFAFSPYSFSNTREKLVITNEDDKDEHEEGHSNVDNDLDDAEEGRAETSIKEEASVRVDDE